MNVIIVHGAFGYPTENWFDWLRHELEMEKIQCLVPTLPTPLNQSLDKWLSAFSLQAMHAITDETILIGHSLGATFLLRWFERNPTIVKSVILVGGFVENIGHPTFDMLNHSFINEKFNWSKLRKTGNQFESYYGNDDPYVSRVAFDEIAKNLHARKIIVANAGHFNAASGYHQFSLLRHRILNTPH